MIGVAGTDVLRGKTVLVADDEQDLREILRDELLDAGCNVIEAGNGNEAYERSVGRVIDAIISDVRMPGGDGVQLLRRLRAINPFSPVVILMSGYSDIPHLHVYQLGAYSVFSKPFRLKDLMLALRMSLSEPGSPKRRRHPRIAISLGVDLELSESGAAATGMPRKLTGTTLTVGRGGFFVRLDSELPREGERLRFRFSSFEGEGICRWSCRGGGTAPDELARGIGVEFADMPELGLAQLTELLETFSGT